MEYVDTLGLVLSVAALLGLGLSGPGHRLGLWGYKTGIGLVKFSAMISLVAINVCLIGLALWNWEETAYGRACAIAGFVIAGCILIATLKWKRRLDSLPYIHDITTDTHNPPAFVAVLPLRAGAENSAEYGGPELARQQAEGYPALQPGSVGVPPDVAFPDALQVAKDMGWEIVDSNPQAFQIEATDTTPWFGFKDDVVVRITPSSRGSRIDVRSASRVGKSDVGANARRISNYLQRVQVRSG